jgi:hypothetical protein
MTMTTSNVKPMVIKLRLVNRFRVIKSASPYNGCRWVIKDMGRLGRYLHKDLRSDYQSTIYSGKIQAWYKTRKEARDTIDRWKARNDKVEVERVDISRVW